MQHLTESERYWFGYHLAGRAEEFDGDFGMVVPQGVSAEEVLADYAEAIRDSDEAILRTADMDAPIGSLVDGEHLSLRWLVTHVSGETTRHAGHADILRELIDGATGR